MSCNPRLAAQVVHRAWDLGTVVYYVGGTVLEITPSLVLSEAEGQEVARYAGW